MIYRILAVASYATALAAGQAVADTAGYIEVGDLTLWMLGAGITLALGVGGWVVTALNRLSSRIEKQRDELHSRVNVVRDEYAKKAEVDALMSRLDRDISAIRADLAEVRAVILERLPNAPKH